jgi:preprotein translocase subunit SecD
VWSIALTLSSDALRVFNGSAAHCFNRALDCPSGQIAIVIDGVVVSSPEIQQPGFEADQFQISGDYTEAEARDLASRFG